MSFGIILKVAFLPRFFLYLEKVGTLCVVWSEKFHTEWWLPDFTWGM